MRLAGGSAGSSLEHWLLSGAERGNDATQLLPWTAGNEVRVLLHGREYFPLLAAELDATGPGDLVLIAGWRMDAEELLTGSLTVADALSRSARRGAQVKGLLWRSHPSWIVGTLGQNRELAADVNASGAEMLLDHRVRRFGSHHQKFVVIRRAAHPGTDVAFVGGMDLARSRGDDEAHQGDPQPRSFAAAYGPTPAWHDVQLLLRGPAVLEVEKVFRERWNDPAPMTRLPWHRLPDVIRGLRQKASPLPPARPAPPAAGGCDVQLLRTYPKRSPGYPFAPGGERSVARGYAKALRRARQLVYVEDQYLWSADVGRVFAEALHRNPGLHVIAVCPRFPDQEGRLKVPPALFGQGLSWRMVHDAGGDRVLMLDIENGRGWPIYVHSKVCVVDDVWAAVGSANLNRRSWSHDSELTAAVLDEQRDPRHPADPAKLGDGARPFARDLRLRLLCEHLGRVPGNNADLLDPREAVRAIRSSADELDAWHRAGRLVPRPPGRLRTHTPAEGSPWQRRLAAPAYRLLFDPDGRPLRMRLRRRY